jgi:hypothetical protein
LLNCQGNIGMFANYNGQTTRPPMTWCNGCIQFQIAIPYVLCLTADSIKVYNLQNSKFKQEINIIQPKWLKYVKEENFFLISTPSQVCALNVASATSQIEQLLNNKQVDEAISLFDMLNTNLSQQKYEEVTNFKEKTIIKILNNCNLLHAN